MGRGLRATRGRIATVGVADADWSDEAKDMELVGRFGERSPSLLRAA